MHEILEQNDAKVIGFEVKFKRNSYKNGFETFFRMKKSATFTRSQSKRLAIISSGTVAQGWSTTFLKKRVYYELN